VRLVGTDFGTISNSDGYFELSNVPSGSYKLEARFIGFMPYLSNIKVDTQKPLSLKITLEESVTKMNEVVVTGTMQPTFVSQSPIKVDVVTSAHINTFMPAAASGLVESISLVSGVQQVVACGVCFTNSISINGLPGPYTAILMDGTPMFGNLASVYGLNGIPSMVIDRFEVIKGPSSTLYGSEAVAGVINIITKDPKTQPLISLDLMTTSHLESFGNLAIAPKSKWANGFVGINYAYINDFDDVNSDGFSDMANLDRVSVFTKWDFDRKSKKPFFLSAKYYHEDRRNGVEEYLNNRNYRHLRGDDAIYGESIYTNRLEVFGTYSLATKENLKVDYSFSTHKQNSYYGSDFYQAEQQIAYTNFIWNKEIKTHQILTGITNRWQAYDDNTVATMRIDASNKEQNERDIQYIPGLFVQDEWEFAKKFILLAGVRLDHYARHGFVPAPRLNAKWKVGQWTTLRSNFGTGFRVVNLFTEDHAFVTGQREVIIGEALKPERSYNFSLNANHIYVLGASQGSIDVDAYYTHFTNKIIPDYNTPNQIIYKNTAGNVITRGISLSVTQEFTFPLAMNLGYNFQRVTENAPNDLGVWQTNNIPFAPRWSGVLTANYRLKQQKMSFAYTFKFTGPMALPEVYDLQENGEKYDTPRPTTSSPFCLHNIQINKSLKHNFGLYLGMQNIFNYVQAYSPLTGHNDPNSYPGFGINFDTSYAYAPIHGREIYLGITWKME
jgi:outer membrane receptor for ferrienterochelin and colicins